MSNWDGDQDRNGGSPADLRDQLEAAKADADARIEAETATLRRELAFTKAGIDTDTPAGKIFAKGYEGELDVAAITAAASDMGLTSAPVVTDPAAGEQTPSPEVTLEDGEAALLNASQDLSGTPPPVDPPPADPYVEASKLHERLVDDGVDNPTAVGFALNTLANAAERGDQRVIIPSR